MVLESWETKIGMVVLHRKAKKMRATFFFFNFSVYKAQVYAFGSSLHRITELLSRIKYGNRGQYFII